MVSCSLFDVSLFRAILALRITLELILEIRDLPEELRIKVCDDPETCERLAKNDVMYLADISVPALKIPSMIEGVARTFCNVVWLDVEHIFEGVGGDMPSVTKLTMQYCRDTDVEWLRISNMFNNVEDLTVTRGSDRNFTFTESWLTGHAFPELKRLKITALNILFAESARWCARSLRHLRLVALDNAVDARLFQLLYAMDIQSFSVIPLEGLVRKDWWKRVWRLHKLRLQPSMYPVLDALTKGYTLSTKILYCSCPSNNLGPLLAFVQQEADTLRILDCFFFLGPEFTRRMAGDVARKIFVDNPEMNIVKVTASDHPRSVCFVFFVPSARNRAWIRKKMKDDARDVVREYFVADKERNIGKVEWSEFE